MAPRTAAAVAVSAAGIEHTSGEALDGVAALGDAAVSTAGPARFAFSGRRALLAGLLFALSLALRLPELDVFLTPDETRWACRSANFWNALSEGRFTDTYQKEHPGVITMWLGGLGLPVDPEANWAIACRDIPASELVEVAPRPALDAIRDRLFAGRARIAVFVSAGIAAIYLLAAGIIGTRAALLGGVLLAADPFMIALGRVLHLDAVTATLMTLALLALLRARADRAAERGDREDRGDRDGRADRAPDGRQIGSGLDPGDRDARGDLGGRGDRDGRSERDFRSWAGLFAAGAVAGVAALNKSPGLFLGPVAGLIFLVDAWRRSRSARAASPRPPLSAVATSVALDTARPLLAWGLGAVAAYVALWPAMWVAPIDSLAGVLLGATDYASEGHEGFNYFMGRPLLDPGPLFYPVAWFVRATPVAVVGLALAAWRGLAPRAGAPPARRGERGAVAWLLAFALLFGLFMTLGAKKFDRYLLPSLPALALVGGWGWAGAVGWAERAWRDARSPGAANATTAGRGVIERGRDAAASPAADPLAAGLLAAILLATALPLRPYFYQFFNPLAGGQRAAPGILLVGWGEGIDGAARWLNAQPDAETLEVATRYRSAFGPLFRGRALEMNKIDPATVDYYLFYLNQIQRHLDPELMERYFPAVDWRAPFDELWRANAITPGAAGPVQVVRIGEIDYAWLFENDTWRAASAFIHARSDPDTDAVLARADSRFARMYVGPLPIIPLDPDGSESDVVETLREAFAAHGAVWLVRYDEIAPRPGLARLDYEIGTRTFTTARVELPELRVTRHEDFRIPVVAGGPEFGVAPTLEPLPGTVRFGDALALDRIGRTADDLAWGRDLGLNLEWRAERDLDTNYTAFVHLIGPDGRRWAHEDRMIGDADLVPTERWAPGEPMLDARALRIPPGTPPGAYRLLLGVYDGATGERLPVTVDGEPQADEVYAIPVMVGRSPAVPDADALALDHLTAPPEADPLAGIRVAEDLAFVGYDVADEAGVHGGRTASVGLVWRVPDDADAAGGAADDPTAAVRLRLVDAADRQVAEGVFDLVPGMRAEARRPGDVLTAWYDLAIDPKALAGDARLIVEPLDQGSVSTPLRIAGPARIFDPPDNAELGSAVDVRFGEVALLRGAVVPETPAAGLDLRLWWEALGETEVGYTRFVHVIDGAGAIRAQIDGVPEGEDGQRPTTSWLAGEFVPDAPVIPLGAELERGEYTLAVGLYDAGTGERLPAYGPEGGRLPDDRVVVGRIRLR